MPNGGIKMDKLIEKGVDSPRQPCPPYDIPVFENNHLIGVTRRTRWAFPVKQNSEFRVLVVNDQSDMADMYSWLLRSWGFQVATAYDGITGLEAVRTSLPDLVVLNCMMPGLTGLEVLERLRREARTAEVKVIIESASPVGKLAWELGAQEFLHTPFSPGMMFEKVSRVLRS